MIQTHDIVVANGDGIGPEIMAAVLEILRAAECPLRFEFIDIGETLYKKGWKSGIPDSAWDAIKKSKILLKAPITTPSGGGYKSLNVTLRRKLGLNVNLRPCRTYLPFLGNHEMDIVFVRENEEDLYCGVEFQRNNNTYECVKIITEDCSTKICQAAFEYARHQGRKKVTCMVKDNIMKMTDGCFYRAFQKVAAFYPEIETERYIIDIGSARIAARPQEFDVVVTENLYGDIISDIGAEVAGSVGVAGSANLGDEYAMFEAIHGSAPTMSENSANPSGLLNGAIMMLRHLKLHEKADLIENAWLATLEQGMHTKDFKSSYTKQVLGTKEFGQAVIENLGNKPGKITPVNTSVSGNQKEKPQIPLITNQAVQKVVGVDISINIEPEIDADKISAMIDENLPENLRVRAMSSKGMKIWPEKPLKINPYTYVKVRIASRTDPGSEISQSDIAQAYTKIATAGVDICRVDVLYSFDDEPGFSVPQGD